MLLVMFIELFMNTKRIYIDEDSDESLVSSFNLISMASQRRILVHVEYPLDTPTRTQGVPVVYLRGI